jgi:hypothetical protein
MKLTLILTEFRAFGSDTFDDLATGWVKVMSALESIICVLIAAALTSHPSTLSQMPNKQRQITNVMP